VTINKVFLALALGMALMACNPPDAPSPAPTETAKNDRTKEDTANPQEAMKNNSMHSRFVVERRFVYGKETHILIDGETGMECVRNAEFNNTNWDCVVTR
jgi:hypothetical protein